MAGETWFVEFEAFRGQCGLQRLVSMDGKGGTGQVPDQVLRHGRLL